MPADASVWNFAGVTAAVGMGVVFTALFLLSIYMHYFKYVTARLERRTHSPPPTPARPTPSLKPVPAPAARDEEGARLAAAVAVGLHLRGVRGGPASELAAAIAAALMLHGRDRARPAGPLPRPASGWKLAGRLETMSSRSHRQQRPPIR